ALLQPARFSLPDAPPPNLASPSIAISTPACPLASNSSSLKGRSHPVCRRTRSGSHGVRRAKELTVSHAAIPLKPGSISVTRTPIRMAMATARDVLVMVIRDSTEAALVYFAHITVTASSFLAILSTTHFTFPTSHQAYSIRIRQ